MSAESRSLPHGPVPPLSLKAHVRMALKHYFAQLDGSNAANIYQLVIEQILPPMLETVMEEARGNQSKAAHWLGLNRGTLRKLLEKYALD